jgi:thiol-disulfide isomerase/thioredoxin
MEFASPHSSLNHVMSAGGRLNSTTLIIICSIALFAIVSIFYYYYYVAPSLNVKYKANNEINSEQTSHNAELILFYATWCPHSKVARPIWEELKNEYENKNVNGYQIVFTGIDCSEETPEIEKIVNKYNIEGYPTIKLIKDGKVIEYDTKPSKETLEQFLNTVL